MSYNRKLFYEQLLRALHAPVNEHNLKALTAWGECEGSNARYNPLDTTQWEPNAEPYNTFYVNGHAMHVWNYHNEADGVRATVKTMENGHYPHILAELRSGSGHIVNAACKNEMKTWGTNPSCIAERLR